MPQVDGEKTFSPMAISKAKPVVAMVSDFFYPGLGGVEMHIYQLSECLISVGYKVVVITHFRGNRHGVRYMTNGMYFILLLSIFGQA